jgi:hypothetical protein
VIVQRHATIATENIKLNFVLIAVKLDQIFGKKCVLSVEEIIEQMSIATGTTETVVVGIMSLTGQRLSAKT